MEQDTAVTIRIPRDPAERYAPPSDSGGELGASLPMLYAPQPHSFYYRGYEHGTTGWNDQHQVFGVEGMDVASSGIYGDNRSFLFHNAFGYNPSMAYTPYSPVTSPLPPIPGDAQVYSQQFPFSGPHYYPQLVSSPMPFIASAAPITQSELVAVADQQVGGTVLGSRSYVAEHGSLDGRDLTGDSRILPPYDLQQGFDGFRPGIPFSDWSNSARTPQPAMHHPTGTFRSAGMTAQPYYGVGSSIANNRVHAHTNFSHASRTPSFAPFGTDARSYLALENKWPGRGGSFCRGCSTTGAVGEQNRGPRSSRLRNRGAHVESMEQQNPSNRTGGELYNRADFVTHYEDARFFIIKSYSEDNIHRSIKYGIWASTTNGNKKLDGAYHESKEQQCSLPIFLFFSVNASAHFCGVAEMVGAVNFEKSADYWVQDKWSGQFPVRWHIIKDVPNTQFRHIILENNDHKPVTNSRDTQEVKLEQGIEMLGIFKNYKADASILDDFGYYEGRQKAIQEQKVGLVQPRADRQIDQLSMSFAQALRVEDGDADGPGTITNGPTSADG